MDFKDIKNQAVKLYKNGATMEEIKQKTGIEFTPDTIQKWIKEDEYNSYKHIIFKLYSKQRKEQDRDKRTQIQLELKQKLEKVLEIVPDDIDMQTKLMYTNINLKDIDSARRIGYKLLEQTNSREVLNGVSIIEEQTGNYDKALEMIEQILSKDPNNEFYKSKKERLQNKKEKDGRNQFYAQIATLERSVKRLIEQKQEQNMLQGEKADIKKITREVYKEVYSKVRIISETILAKFPDEIIAREKLVKSLYLIGKKDIAKSVGEEFLQTNSDDEVILWYMCKIERDQGNLQREKQYLERIANISSRENTLKIEQRLEKVNLILERQEERKNEKEEQQHILTEEDREVWIENIQKEFSYGNISLEDISEKIKQARGYPNYVKSLIELLDIKANITEDFQGEIEELNEYLETEYSISKEDYKQVLDAMTRIKRRIDEKRIIDNYYNAQEDNSVDGR